MGSLALGVLLSPAWLPGHLLRFLGLSEAHVSVRQGCREHGVWGPGTHCVPTLKTRSEARC